MTQTSIDRQISSPVRPGTVLGWGRTVGKRAGGEQTKIVKFTVDQERNTHDYVLAALAGFTKTGASTSESDLTFTSDASGTKEEIRDGMIATVLANQNATRRVIPYADSSNVAVFYLEGRQPGDDFAFTESDDDISNEVTQAAASPASIPFGGGVCRIAGTEDVCLPSLVETAAVVAVAKVVDVTPTFSAGDEWAVTVELSDGRVITAVVTMTTDLATTLDGMVEALNDALPASSVDVTDGATKMTLTAETAGEDFTVTSTASDVDDAGNTTPVTITEVTANVAAQAASYALAHPFAGIAEKAPTEQTPAGSGILEHEATASLPVRTYGPVAAWIEPGITPTPGTDSVYLRCVTSGDKKRAMLTNTHVVGETVLIPGLTWSSEGKTGDWSSVERTAPVFVDVK